jgi:hypothetical protein
VRRILGAGVGRQGRKPFEFAKPILVVGDRRREALAGRREIVERLRLLLKRC